MDTANKQTQIVFSLALTNYLIKNGFHVVEVKFHKSKKDTAVFFFENSKELQEAIAKYIKFNS